MGGRSSTFARPEADGRRGGDEPLPPDRHGPAAVSDRSAAALDHLRSSADGQTFLLANFQSEEVSPPTYARPQLDGGAEEIDAACFRHSPRPLRDPRAARRGRDGRGLQGEGHAARAHRRDQGAAGAVGAVGGGAPAVRAGGEDDLAALPSTHLRALRRRTGGRDRVSRDGASRGGDARRAAREGCAAAGADAAVRRRDRGRSGQGAPAGDRAPGPEARQRDADEVGREAARLRAGEGDGAGRRRSRA